jgi:exportin-5
MADNLLPMYDELERQIQHIITTRNPEEGHKLGYQAFLFIIILKSKGLDGDTKLSKLKDMMSASTATWADPQFANSVLDFESFLKILGLGPLPEYLYSRNFHKIQDWAGQSLDADGQAIQASVTDRVEVCATVV